MDHELEQLIADEARIEAAILLMKLCDEASFEVFGGNDGLERKSREIGSLQSLKSQVTKKIRQINRNNHS